ncbi:MAG: hypothetical protein M0R68_05280 [Bacteroidetes bacterium]|nr:hypothetical protein [Bacteroidota bacterium]
MFSTIDKKYYVIFLILYLWQSLLNAQSVSGYVKYEDYNSGGQLVLMPLQNARIRIETYFPTQTYETSTNSSGYYSQGFGNTPTQVVTRIFFENSKIEMRGVTTTRSTFKSIVGIGKVGPFSPCPPGIPCDFDGGGIFQLILISN